MSFPLHIGRGVKSTLNFKDDDALRQWVTHESEAWGWLSTEAKWGADQFLQIRVMEAQVAPWETLRGLCDDDLPFTPDMIDFAEAELKRVFVEGKVFVSTDPGIRDVIASSANISANALGMLAQALGVNVESESADAFAGRQAWLNKLPGALSSAIPERIDALDQQIQAAENALKLMQTEVATHAGLRALSDAQRRNGKWMAGLSVMTAIWVCAAAFAAASIHQMTMQHVPTARAVAAQSGASPPKSGMLSQPAPAQASEAVASVTPATLTSTAARDEPLGWPELTERFTLYLLLITAFTWGLRWLGRFFQDVWAAGQSASRRLSSLRMVLDDRESMLFKHDDKGRERILAEIFDDRPQTAKSKDKDDEGPQLELLDKLLDVLKKAREVALPEK